MGMQILVAEDSPSFSLLYKTSLEKRGHKVTLARDGNECLYKYMDAIEAKGKENKNPFPLGGNAGG